MWFFIQRFCFYWATGMWFLYPGDTAEFNLVVLVFTATLYIFYEKSKILTFADSTFYPFWHLVYFGVFSLRNFVIRDFVGSRFSHFLCLLQQFMAL